MRIGHGYDAHRFKAGRKCILCGVEIPSDFGPDGYSDADVAIHALIDALLGSLALGDIGKHFPDTEPQYKGISSIELLLHITELINSKGWTLGNADITIIARRPKMAPYIEDMRYMLSKTMNVSVDSVSVKATSEEDLGFTGDLSGIAAHAVVTVEKINTQT